MKNLTFGNLNQLYYLLKNETFVREPIYNELTQSYEIYDSDGHVYDAVMNYEEAKKRAKEIAKSRGMRTESKFFSSCCLLTRENWKKIINDRKIRI